MLFGEAFVMPLAITTLPVMIGVLMNALQGTSIWNWIFFGFPIALIIAVFLTFYQLQTTTAEVYIGENLVALRSLYDCMQDRRRLRWKPVLSLRESHSFLIVTLTDADYVLRKDQWEDRDALRADLRRAMDAYELTYPT